MAQSTISDRPFLDYRHYLRERYGCLLYRVPVDLGFGCPHRDADRVGRCTFCAAQPARTCSRGDLVAQVEAGVRGARERYGAERYIAYFQAGTATHAPIEVLRERVATVLGAGTFPVVVFATRPDCLPETALDYLAELARDRDVWVELGVQTCHDRTLRTIQRGHDFACSVRAARALHDRGIVVAAHVILGLPGEGMTEFVESARRLRAEPFSAIKIHNLHILRGTALEVAWRRGQLEAMDEHAYGEALMTFLRHVPATWPVLRLTADTPPDQRLAPRWWMSKGDFRRYVSTQMTQRGWAQGDLVPAAAAGIADTVDDPPPGRTRRLRLVDLPWERRRAASPLNGLLDAATVRLEHPGHSAVVLAIGFGQGPLALDGLDILPGRISPRVVVHGLAGDATSLARMRLAYPDQAGLLSALEVRGRCRRTWGRVALHWGDPRQTVMRLAGGADLVLLEPEHTDEFPAVFSLDFLRRVVRVMPPGGVLLTACVAPVLRGALLRLGMAVGQAAVHAALPRGGTVAAWTPESLRVPLSERDRRTAMESTAGIPYRDRALNWTRKRILQYHERLCERMRSRGMPAKIGTGIAVTGVAVGGLPE